MAAPAIECSHQEYVEIGSGEPIQKENLVEFHLLYSGHLHSAGYEQQRKEKHDIRKVFHAQLLHLWEIQPNLRERAVDRGIHEHAYDLSSQLSQEAAFKKGIQSLGKDWERNGFRFLPLVTEAVCLRCRLDILFLRREEKDYVLQGGDIDGRLKILFDALRMTNGRDDLPPGATPEQDEDPFCCLLQDDKLISEVHVNTGALLMLPGVREMDKHDVYLQITVRVNTTRKVANSWMFE